MNITYNAPYVDNLWERNNPMTQSKASQQMLKDRMINQERQSLTQRTMEKMNKIIDETIKRNNHSLYEQLLTFINELNNRQSRFDSQVPTCLILTSSESASSID